jgi:hypothetical protein
VIPSPARNDRQRVQELIQTLELLAEDQKKKNKAFDPREPIFFNQLVAVIGADRAKDLVDKTQKLASEGNDPAGAAKLMRDIAELITASTLGAKYGVDATTVEKELRQQLPSSPRKGAEAAREVISRVSFEPQKGQVVDDALPQQPATPARAQHRLQEVTQILADPNARGEGLLIALHNLELTTEEAAAVETAYKQAHPGSRRYRSSFSGTKGGVHS